MTGDAGFCGLTASLAEVAVTMWQRDCGVVPVVDREKKVVGMITDRDICMACATRNRVAAEIMVSEVVSGKVFACRADDDVETALKTMRRQQLRRLAVTDADNVLVGVLSISDCLRHAGKGKQKIARKKVFAALRDISSFHTIQLRELAAEPTAESSSAKLNAKPSRRASKKKQNANGLDQTAADNNQIEISAENPISEANPSRRTSESAPVAPGVDAADGDAGESANDKSSAN